MSFGMSDMTSGSSSRDMMMNAPSRAAADERETTRRADRANARNRAEPRHQLAIERHATLRALGASLIRQARR